MQVSTNAMQHWNQRWKVCLTFSSFNMFATLSPQVELRIWQKYRLQHCAIKCIEPAVNHSLPLYVIYHISWLLFRFSIIYWDEIQLASLCEKSLLNFFEGRFFFAPPCPPFLSENLTQAWMGASVEQLCLEPCACFSASASSAHVSALQRIFQRFMHQHSVPPAKNGYGYWSWNTMIWRVKISKFYFPVACKVQNTSIQKLKPKQMMYHPFYKIKFPKA